MKPDHEAGHCAAAIAFGSPIIAPSKPMRDTCTVVIIENELAGDA
jgi:hypothetical protein